MMDIGLDLQRAYDEGYKKRWEESEAYALHCSDETTTTNADRLREMTDEELAWFIGYYGCPPNTHNSCPKEFAGEDETDCEACWLKWLKEEVEE